MDKKLARTYVKKVSPLEHSKNPKDRKVARKFESKLRRLNGQVPKRIGA